MRLSKYKPRSRSRYYCTTTVAFSWLSFYEIVGKSKIIISGTEVSFA